jgi:hypothetical protein
VASGRTSGSVWVSRTLNATVPASPAPTSRLSPRRRRIIRARAPIATASPTPTKIPSHRTPHRGPGERLRGVNLGEEVATGDAAHPAALSGARCQCAGLSNHNRSLAEPRSSDTLMSDFAVNLDGLSRPRRTLRPACGRGLSCRPCPAGQSRCAVKPSPPGRGLSRAG